MFSGNLPWFSFTVSLIGHLGIKVDLLMVIEWLLGIILIIAHILLSLLLIAAPQGPRSALMGLSILNYIPLHCGFSFFTLITFDHCNIFSFFLHWFIPWFLWGDWVFTLFIWAFLPRMLISLSILASNALLFCHLYVFHFLNIIIIILASLWNVAVDNL